MPSKYRVTTDQGTFEITVDDGDSAPAEKPSDSTGLALAAAGNGIPAAANAAMHVATSPNAGKIGSMLGQITGGIEGAMKGGPMGAAGGVWAGGKAGWFTGKLAQRLAAPVASGLEKVAPYAQALSTLGGAQGVNDLAQMAEPNRKDIGFLGMGPSVDVPSAEPPWLNAVLGRLYGRLTGK